jgi:hypothetical protein
MSGNHTLVAMKRADGTMDSIVHLPDATTVKPASDGTVMIPGLFVMAMINAGYTMTVGSGTVHIP